MKKTLLFTVSLFLLGTGTLITAQEVQNVTEDSSSEQIELADITTVVNTASLVADSETLPDFLDVVEIQDGSGKIVPQLPDIDGMDSSTAEVITKATKENSIYAEGKIGGGYPLGMYGDFKIYKLNETSPFEFSFLHDSASGYSRTGLNEGYNDSTNCIGIDKSYVFDKTQLNLALNYLNTKNGLQDKVAYISDVNQNTLSTAANVDWNFAKGFNFGGGVGVNFYNRYLDITSINCSDVIEDWAKGNWTIGALPSMFFVWEDYGFKVDVDSSYSFINEFEKVHRGQVGLGFSWKNDNVKVFTNVDAVFGNHLNGNVVAVPFDAGINITFPVKFATRQFGINLTGGMNSERTSISDLEKKYKFTALSFTPEESSDWFGRFEIIVPVKESFVFNGKIEYCHTAFGNGILEPVYTGNATSGMYTFDYVNRQNLVTDFTFNYTYGIFGAAAQWHSNWIYVPAMESPQEVDFSFTVQSKDSKWNATLLTGLYISESGFDIPLINIDGLAKITDAVNLALSIEDIVNLFGGQPRTYAGQYISRSGSVTAMIKFFF